VEASRRELPRGGLARCQQLPSGNGVSQSLWLCESLGFPSVTLREWANRKLVGVSWLRKPLTSYVPENISQEAPGDVSV